MLLALTFNQLVIPLVLACLFSLALLALLVKVGKAASKTAQQKRLDALKPPKKGRNHHSLPPKQYYLTRAMAKATPTENHVLAVYVKLHPEEAPASPAAKK